MICSEAQTDDGYCEFCGTLMEVPVDARGFKQEAFCGQECRLGQADFEAEAEKLFDRQC